MPDRLSPLDASFLFAEDRTTAMHIGGVMTFEQPAGGPFDVGAFTDLIEQRLHLVPRYRQKVRMVPGGLGLPVWVDDPDFDIHYHVRHSALPAPGTDAVLRELVGRLLVRHLDRSRPLWEVNIVEGLTGGRFAVVTKTHHAMVDGLASMDIGAALLDLTPAPRPTPAPPWRPEPEPSALALAAGAAVDLLRRPWSAIERAGEAAARVVTDARSTADSVARTVGGVLSTGRRAASARPVGALNAATGQQRRYGTLRTTLADHRKVRKAHGGTVNDVILAVVTGGLRRLLIRRGEPLTESTQVRAMVPVSVRARARETGTIGPAGNSISAYLVDLPVAVTDPVERLGILSAAMEEHKRGGQAVGAATLMGLVGLAPPVLHSLGVRMASRYSDNFYNVLVTNVPGPPRPLYAMGARMLEMYPVVPLGGRQAVAVGITSYDGHVHYGLTADRDAMPDVDEVADDLAESLAELVERSD
ncbi:Diacylglycerol O-acyltransferase [Pseudonocardia thermophila]|uniref:Diacylglycerol O-acyltransferase n=1 Tax=Pseudonocardia thermophila TaxID=1848 RepID=A0A1M6TXG2_PSETH|nr:wax ester/triacylglycerol synthase family O-acyltransferase [Pseudonocardia thermophila]SHK61601.1 Diacylglycerol O-acyltransferase [Pseudonocardia thermophila]